MKVLLENLLRNEDGRTVTKDDIDAVAKWLKKRKLEHEIAFRPARVLMQDFTGVPAVVDLAAMRDAMKKLGGDAEKINPLVPVDLVIDHSVIVELLRRQQGVRQERRVEEYKQQRRALRLPEMGPEGVLEFLRRAARHRHLPPGQSRISRADGLDRKEKMTVGKKTGTFEVAYPDTLVGTNSHTTMVNGLAVLGWGVGGIEAEAAMLGQPLSMLMPEVIGFKLDGQAEGRRHRDRPRAHRHADAAQEGRGRQVRRVLRPRPRPSVGRRPRDHRQHGAGIRRDLRLLPDRRRRRIDYLKTSGRDGRRASRWSRPMPRRRACSAPPSDARSGLHRHADARSRRRRAVAGRTEAPEGRVALPSVVGPSFAARDGEASTRRRDEIRQALSPSTARISISAMATW